MSFGLRELLRATGGKLIGPDTDTTLTDLVTDSRIAVPGTCFVALAGETTDGHRFIPQALQNGASAVLCSRPVEGATTPQVVVADTREALVAFTRSRLAEHGCRVVGVTGSVGKTTTKEMLAAVLARKYQVLKTEGNLNTYTGFPMTVAHLEPRHQVFVGEYAMSASGEIAFLCRMAPPDVAVVLNVGLSHVAMLGSIEAIAAAKQELVEGVGEGGTAVLNLDDPRVAAMASACRGRVVMYSGSGSPEATVRAEDVELAGLEGSQFTLVTPEGRARARLQIPGRQAVVDAVAAAAAAHVMGVPVDEVARALESCQPVAGRMRVRRGRAGSIVIDDCYNASPASMTAALELLSTQPGRRRVAVLGDMLELGDEAEAAHREVGRQAAGVDLLVAVGEYAGDVAGAAAAAGLEPSLARVAESPGEAVEMVTPWLEGSLVLVKASRGVALEAVVDGLVDES